MTPPTPFGRNPAAVVPWFPPEGGEPAAGIGEIRGWLRRWRWTILATFAAVMAAVELLTLAIPTTYHSEVSFLVEPRTPPTLSAGLSVLERLGSPKSTETEIELLHSRRVVEPAWSCVRSFWDRRSMRHSVVRLTFHASISRRAAGP